MILEANEVEVLRVTYVQITLFSQSIIFSRDVGNKAVNGSDNCLEGLERIISLAIFLQFQDEV